MKSLTEDSPIKLGIIIYLLIPAASVCVWVGTLQAKVERLKEDQTNIEVKLDKIQADTSYMRGKIEAATK